MTEHKMTAKGFIHKKFEGLIDAVSLESFEEEKVFTVDEVESMLKKFALQVATEAVEEEQENVPKKEVWVTCDVSDLIHRVSNNVLENIKKRLNDE